MLVEEFSETSDVDMDGSSLDDPSDEIFPENYYDLEGIAGLISDPKELLIEKMIENPTESDRFYFEKTKELLIDGSIPVKYGSLFIQRAFSIPIDVSLQTDFTHEIDTFLQEKYQGSSKTTGFCRKYLKKSMGFGYVCVDCMSHNKNSFVCADCFKHSDHQGHKIMKLVSSGVCDCGDFDNVRYPYANCSKHRGGLPQDHITTEESKSHFKIELQSFLSVQYSFLVAIDFTLKPTVGNVIVQDVLQALKDITTKYPALVSLVSNSLLQKLERISSFKLLQIKNMSKSVIPYCLLQHPTMIRLKPEETENPAETNGTISLTNQPSELQESASKLRKEDHLWDNLMLQNDLATSQKNLELILEEIITEQQTDNPEARLGMKLTTAATDRKAALLAVDDKKDDASSSSLVQVFGLSSSVDLLFTYALQLHVLHAKKLVELIVHFSTVPDFKSKASISWVSCLTELISPSLKGDDLHSIDKFISPLFDLCDQFLVDGKSLQELFLNIPPVHWIHLMGKILESMLKIADESIVILFLDKRLWEDFLIDVLDSILANKSWNSILLQNEQFVGTLVRFFINTYHHSLSLPITRPDDEMVTIVSYIAQESLDFQAICITFSGKMVSRLLLHPPEVRSSILLTFRKTLTEELMPYRNFRCGVLVPKTGIDLSLYRLLSLLCCVENAFDSQIHHPSGIPEVRIFPIFKNRVKSIEDGLASGSFINPTESLFGDRKLAQLLFVESSRVYGFNKQLAHNVWGFMGEISDMICHEYGQKCLDTTDRLAMQLTAAELTPAFVFYCTASRVLFPPVPKDKSITTAESAKPEEGAKLEPVEHKLPCEEQQKPELPNNGQKISVLQLLRICSESQLDECIRLYPDESKLREWVAIPAELEDMAFTKIEAQFGVHEFEKFFWYYENHFKKSDWNKRITYQTKAMLLAEYFNTLYLIYTDEYALSFVCEAILSEVTDSIKDHQSSGDKFYLDFLKQEFAAIILALSPISVPDLLEEAQFLTPEKEILERFIEELCEIDTEKHVVRLKKKVKETVTERLDLSTASYKSNIHSKLMEGWSTNVDKCHHDKLRLRDLSVASPFTKYLRYRLASAWPWDIYIATIGICKLVPDWKKVVGPLCAMLKFVLQYLEVFGSVSLLTRNIKKKQAFDWFISPFIKYLEGEVKSSPLLKSFKQKVNQIRDKYFSYGQDLNIDVVVKAEVIETEMMDEENIYALNQVKLDQALKTKFEVKKQAAFAKIKAQQSYFVNEMDNASFDNTRAIKPDLNNELECAVTKEKILPSEVYYLHSQLHFTNLVNESIRTSLTVIAENIEQHDSEDVQTALDMIEKLATERHLLEDIVVSCCGHIIKSVDSASRSVLEIYDLIERPCAICKKPTNLMVPVYPVDLFYKLHDNALPSGIMVKQSQIASYSLELFIVDLMDFQKKFSSALHSSEGLVKFYSANNEWHQTDFEAMEDIPSFDLPESNLSKSLKNIWSGYQKDELVSRAKKMSTAATTEMLDFYRHFISLRSKVVGDLLTHHHGRDAIKYSVLDWSWGNPDDAAIYQVSPMAVSCWVFYSNIRYMELRGLEPTVRAFGLLLHNLYLNMKLCSINDGMTLEKRSSLFLEYLGKLHHNEVADRTKYEIVVLTLLITLSNSSEQEALFHQVLNYLVDLHVRIFLEAHQLTVKWEDLRYLPTTAPFINSLLRLLRTAALIKYAWKYPVYQTAAGKLFEKLVQFNLRADARELDYLFLFLELDTPSTLQDALDRVQNLGKLWTADSDQPMEKIDTEVARGGSDLRLQARLLSGIPNFIFSLVRLPSQLRLLYDQYLFEPCDKCNWRRELMGCLICGAKWCQRRCHPDSEHKKLVSCGNATTHSMLHHNGTAAFVDCGNGHILIVEGNRINVYPDAYKDKFGLVPMSNLNDASNCLEKYTLYRERFAEVKSNLLNQEVVQTTVLKSLTDDKIFHRNLM